MNYKYFRFKSNHDRIRKYLFSSRLGVPNVTVVGSFMDDDSNDAVADIVAKNILA